MEIRIALIGIGWHRVLPTASARKWARARDMVAVDSAMNRGSK
jgi:hypothetical protein